MKDSELDNALSAAQLLLRDGHHDHLSRAIAEARNLLRARTAVPFDPKLMTPTVISVWASTQAVRQMWCPRCQADADVPCHTPSGRKRPEPHLERTRAYREFIGEAEFNRRHQRGMAVRP